MRLTFLAAAAFAAAACASGPAFERYARIPEDKGRLYVYRPPAGFWGSFVRETFWLSDRELAVLRAGEYTTVTLDAGRYLFTFEGGWAKADVDRRIKVRAGRAVYCGYEADDPTERTRYFCTDDREDHDYHLRRCHEVAPVKDSHWGR